MTATPDVVAKALEQVELGFAVFALGIDSKVPVTERGFKNATRDPEWVRKQLAAPSAGNYGMTWPEDADTPVVVFDLDDGGGVEGVKWRDKVLELTQRYGALPKTKTTNTPSNGRHAYYAWPADIPIPPGDELFGFTVRWPGRGYLVGPGSSLHGKAYTAGDTRDIAMLPAEWVRAAVEQATPRRPMASGTITITGGFELPAVIPPGRRYPTVRDYVASRYNAGLAADELWALVRTEVAPRFAVPKTDEELRDDFERAMDKIEERLGPPRKGGPTGHEAVVASQDIDAQNLATVKVEAVRWLWHRYLPIGSVTLFDGNPGEGKSTIVADLIARLTTGGAWPDGTPITEPGTVLYVTKEDDASTQVRPRIEAAGGDASRVWFVATDLLFPRDMPRFRELLERVRPRLVLLDPLMSYLEGRVRAISDNEVRSALMTPLAEAARDMGCAMLVIRHFAKGTGQTALQKGAGSLGGLAGAARMVVALHRDSQSDDERARVFGAVKSNYEAIPPSFRLLIESAPVEGFQMTVSRATWLGQSETTVIDLMERTREQHEQVLDAEDAMRELLTGGPKQSTEVQSAMKARGHTKHAVYQAMKALRVQVERTGFPSRTTWSLPVVSVVPVVSDPETTGRLDETAVVPPAISQTTDDEWDDWQSSQSSQSSGRPGDTRARARVGIVCSDFRAHQTRHIRNEAGFICPVCQAAARA